MNSRARLALVVSLSIPPLAFLAVAQQAAVLRFRSVSVMDDPRRIGGEAYRLLAPADWRADNNVMWHNSAANTANPWVRLIGPARQEIGTLPPITFIWNDRLMAANYKPGSLYAGLEVQFPALDPFQAIDKIVIPRFRRQLENASIVKQEKLPELAAANRAKYPQPEYRNAVFQAGKARFEYAENGVQMQEDVYILTAAVQIPSAQNGPPAVSTLWSLDEIRYSKAPKGTLDAQLPLFEACLFSLRPNLKWFGRLQEISQEYSRLRAQADNPSVARALEQGAIVADRMDSANRSTELTEQLNARNLKRYQNRQQVADGINAHLDRSQVEVYRNPSTAETVQLPSGYRAAWANQNGEYQVAGAPDYDPNASAPGVWTRLEKVNP